MGEEQPWVFLCSPRSDNVSGSVLVSLDQSSGWFLANISVLLVSIQPPGIAFSFISTFCYRTAGTNIRWAAEKSYLDQPSRQMAVRAGITIHIYIFFFSWVLCSHSWIRDLPLYMGGSLLFLPVVELCADRDSLLGWATCLKTMPGCGSQQTDNMRLLLEDGFWGNECGC